MIRRKVSVFLSAVLVCFSISSQASAAASVQYTYDGLNRLTTAAYPDGTTIQYTYDAAGNILTESVAGGQTTVPGAPTGVTAVPGNAQATVSFTTPALYGNSSITGYTVTSSPGKKTASGTVAPITVKGLTNGIAYTFTVTATNKIGTGPPSAASSPVTPAAAPGAPAGLKATAGNGQVVVSFTAPASNGSAIKSYTVLWTPGGGADTTGSPLATSHTVAGLLNGTTYTFTVEAANGVGAGPQSKPVEAMPATVPDAPTGIKATAGNGQVVVSFTAPASNGGDPITSYIVTPYNGTTAGRTTSGPATAGSITVKGLTNGTAYTFTVTAKNKLGSGQPSAASSPVIPAAAPGAPTGIKATAGNGQVVVSFTAPASTGGLPITAYTVIWTPHDGSDTPGSPLATSHTVTGLHNGTTYTFNVEAANAIGTGPQSNPVKAMPATVPGTPTIGTATAGHAEATVNFTPPASNGGDPITSYIVTAYINGTATGITGSGPKSPITVKGLTGGQAYTFKVAATNMVGTGAVSGFSNPPVTPTN